MKKVNNKKGFTLAELLVVVAILAILIAIAVPIFGGALDSAKKTAIDSNIRALKSAGMVDILTNTDESLKVLGTSDKGWKVTAHIEDSEIGTVKVEKTGTIGTDAGPTTGEVDGDYIVYLEPTDLT